MHEEPDFFVKTTLTTGQTTTAVSSRVKSEDGVATPRKEDTPLRRQIISSPINIIENVSPSIKFNSSIRRKFIEFSSVL